MMNKKLALSALCAGLLISLNSYAITDQEKGLEIAVAADERDSGWGSMRAQMEMILENRAGKTSTRKIESRQLEVDGDGDKSLSLFKEPRDVSGTAMLTFSHGVELDDQWLYLPALKRVKRISSKNQSGPFMGSEFAFEDLGSQEVEKYTYRYLREEACGDNMQCTVSERIPAYENSGYKRQIIWIDKAEYRPIRIEFYDRKDALLKTLDFNVYREYNGYWRADQYRMENHQTGKKTLLNWRDIEFGAGLNERDFNQNALKRLM